MSSSLDLNVAVCDLARVTPSIYIIYEDKHSKCILCIEAHLLANQISGVRPKWAITKDTYIAAYV